jgi:hypothetical protein
VGGLSPAAGSVGLILFVVGLICLANMARIWWFLRRHPWRAWQCGFREVPGVGNGSPTLLLTRSSDEEGFVLGVVSFKWRWRALKDCDRAVVWMAGDPARSGVVAPPGGTHLLWVRRPIGIKRRERLRKAILVDGGPTATMAEAQLDQPG